MLVCKRSAHRQQNNTHKHTEAEISTIINIQTQKLTHAIEKKQKFHTHVHNNNANLTHKPNLLKHNLYKLSILFLSTFSNIKLHLCAFLYFVTWNLALPEILIWLHLSTSNRRDCKPPELKMYFSLTNFFYLKIFWWTKLLDLWRKASRHTTWDMEKYFECGPTRSGGGWRGRLLPQLHPDWTPA